MGFFSGIENFFGNTVTSIENLIGGKKPTKQNTSPPAQPATNNVVPKAQTTLVHAVERALGAVAPAATTAVSAAATAENKAGGEASPKAVVQDGPTVLDPSLSSGKPVYRKTGYPAIYGGTQDEADQIWGTMQAMPPEDRQAVNAIHVGSEYTTGTFQVTGDNAQGKDTNYGDIYINTSDLENPDREKYVVLHESGHAVAIHNGTLNGPTANLWKGPDVYGDPVKDHPGENVNPQAETFADAYAAYYGGDGAKLQQTAPAEYNALASKAYQNGNAAPNALDYITGGLNWFGEHVVSPVVGTLAGWVAGPQAQAAVNSGLANLGWDINAFLEGAGGPPRGVNV